MNLKEAARRLNVHYQTAYRWVRSGELAAVRVGTRYEVSDAAIHQFIAGRRAVRYLPDRPRDEERRVTDPTTLDDLLEELEAMTTDPVVTVPSVASFGARRGAEVLGDMSFVVKMDDDGVRPAYFAVDHPRADRSAFLASAIGATHGKPTAGRGVAFDVLLRAEPVRLSHYPQDRLRSLVRHELHQHAPKYPIHSLLAVPIPGRAGPVGVLGFTRDTPSRPYSQADEDFAVRMATRIGWLFETAHDIELAWRIRAELAEACTSLIEGRGSAPRPTTAELDQVLREHPESRELPVVVLDADFRYLAANEAFVRGSGHTLDALLGNRFEAFTHPDDCGSEQAEFARLVSGELDFLDVHARRILADGTHLEYASHRAAVRDPDATLRCVVAVARAIHPPIDADFTDDGGSAGDRVSRAGGARAVAGSS